MGSRTAERAREFGEKFGVPESGHCESVEAAVSLPEVDIVYIGTPHDSHASNALAAIAAGKHVLCEKPFTVTAREAAVVLEAAKDKGVLVMEAMWTRFLPAYKAMREVITRGDIGDIVSFQGDYGFKRGTSGKPLMFSRDHGGGSLLAVGVYPLSIAVDLLGEPEFVSARARLGTETRVDEALSVVMQHPGGALSTITSSLIVESSQEVTIVGTKGRVRIHRPCLRPTAFTVTREGAEDEQVAVPFVGNGYQYQAAELMACVRRGARDCGVMPNQETLAVMRTMDKIRRDAGVVYPMDAV